MFRCRATGRLSPDHCVTTSQAQERRNDEDKPVNDADQTAVTLAGSGAARSSLTRGGPATILSFSDRSHLDIDLEAHRSKTRTRRFLTAALGALSGCPEPLCEEG